jgi:hypothetical protein
VSVNTEKGFTVTELLIASVLGSMLAVTLFSITILFYGGVLRNDVEARLIVESQNILWRVVEDLRISSGVRVSNSIYDANEPVSGWTTSNDDLILIIATPALDSSGNFITDDTTGLPHVNEIIYYADGRSLYKRILAEPAATGNTAVTSCPPAIASPSCPSDRQLTENFKDMNFVFYDQDDIVTTDPTAARSIEILIEMQKQVFGKSLEINNRIRVTMRNSL